MLHNTSNGSMPDEWLGRRMMHRGDRMGEGVTSKTVGRQEMTGKKRVK